MLMYGRNQYNIENNCYSIKIDDPEGWYEEGGGRGVQDGEHMYPHGGFMLMCGRTNTIL